MGGRYRDADELLEDLTARQFAGWQDFYDRNPFGFHVEDLRHGTLLATVLSPHVRGKVDPTDFMFGTALNEATVVEMDAKETEAALDMLFGVATGSPPSSP